MTEFDPYHKWLGIPPEEQPPHHYRLLGMKLFETDTDVIQASADRQMTYLRSLGTGNRAQDVQNLLNEISAAGSCLLTPAKKSAYDANLKTKLVAQKSAEQPSDRVVQQPQPLPPTRPAIGAFDTNAPVTLKGKKKKAASSSTLPWAIGGGFFVAMALLAAVVVFATRTTDGTLDVEVDPPGAVVKLLNAHGKVVRASKSGAGKLTLAVKPGKHRLVVEKDEFAVYTEELDLSARQKKVVVAKLEAIKKVPAAKPPEKVAAKTTSIKPETPTVKPDTTTGAPGMVLEFDGSRTFVATPLFFDGSYPMTVEAWITKADRSITTQYIIGDSENGGIFLAANQGHFEMGYRGIQVGSKPGLLYAVGSVPFVANRLYHVAGVINGNEVRLFVDGISQQTRRAEPFQRSPMPLTIGINPTTKIPDPPYFKDATDVFVGTIREVRISKVARYASDFTPPRRFSADTDTLALYHMDEGSGTVINDASANAKHAKIYGAKWVKDSFSSGSKPAVVASEDAASNPPFSPIAPFRYINSFQQSAFQEWEKQTAALSAEQQVEAVTKKLRELNPDFVGKITPTMEGGVVTGIAIVDDEVKDVPFGAKFIGMDDISPVRAFTGLKSFQHRGQAHFRCRLSNLSPLIGMKLRSVDIVSTSVVDLKSLVGMPLSTLSVGRTEIVDLTPLRGMPLSFLSCEESSVTDLLPLRECKRLKRVRIKSLNVTPEHLAACQRAMPDCEFLDVPAVQKE